MKKLKKRLKVVALFLTGLILLQSCVVYHKTPTTLEQASQLRTKTKITQTDGDTFKFKYISYEDGVYYGVKKKSGELVKTPLDQEYISKVLTKNKSTSTWLTVAAIGIPVIVIIVGIATAGVDVNIGPEIIP